jgi:fructokinase
VETRCLHTGSLATVLPPGKANVVDIVEREHERGRVTVSYDPSVRPALLGDAERARPEIAPLVALSDVVKVSEEDVRWLYPDRSDEDVAQGWLASGPALVVVARGGAGVYAVSARLELRRGAVPIDLVDTWTRSARVTPSRPVCSTGSTVLTSSAARAATRWRRSTRQRSAASSMRRSR